MRGSTVLMSQVVEVLKVVYDELDIGCPLQDPCISDVAVVTTALCAILICHTLGTYVVLL